MTSVKLMNYSSSTADWNYYTITIEPKIKFNRHSEKFFTFYSKNTFNPIVLAAPKNQSETCILQICFLLLFAN